MKNRRLNSLSLVLIIILILAGAGAVYLIRQTPNRAVVNAFDIPDTRLIIGEKVIKAEYPPLIKDGQILLPFDTIKAYIDQYLWYDQDLKKIVVTTGDKVLRMNPQKKDATINENPVELKYPPIEENGTIYLPVEFLADFYQINIRFAENNNVVIIDFKNKLVRTANPLSEKAVIRRGASIHEPIVRKFTPDEIGKQSGSLVVLEEYESWYKVRSYDGVIGYIEKADAVVKDISLSDLTLPESGEAKMPAAKINLVWEMTYAKQNIQLSKETTPGIDVVSPTWFEIIDRKGTIKNRAKLEYVDNAHKNGWKVWALFSNDFGDIEGTSFLLNNTDERLEIIRSILSFATQYKLDGINLDFENIYKKDKGAYTQLVRELYPLLKERGLYLSVDVTVPDGSDTWSKCFDRRALSESADYLCLMAYDQHWSSSPTAGSTAELEWVENNLKRTLLEVPSSKLLLGIPLYTRLWVEENKGGETKVSAKTLNMTGAKKEIEDNQAVVAWSDIGGQYEASYQKDGKTYKLWLEDSDAVNMKTSLVHKYNLGGVSVWAANFADQSVFPIFKRNLKDVSHYQEWKSLYGTQPNASR